MRLEVTRHTGRVWRYHWKLWDNKGNYIRGNFTITILGCRMAARRAARHPVRHLQVDTAMTVFSEDFNVKGEQ